MRDLLALTYGVEAELRAVVDQLDGIDVALIHGSWATGRVRPESDVDLLLVGDADFDEAMKALRRLGKQIGRRIDAKLFKPSEVGDDGIAGSGFIRKILDGPTIVLRGSLDQALGSAR